MKTFANTILVVLLLCVSVSPFLVATQISFEAASIRPDNSGDQPSRMAITGNRLTASNLTVKMLTIAAYKVQEFQIIGGPSWIDKDRYDIAATAADKVTSEQVPELIRNLLVGRFQLMVHHETRELPVYALVVSKNGSKLRASTAADDNHNASTLRGKINGRNIPLETFITLLSSSVDRPVVDKTGLTGNFDLQLEWSPESSRAGPTSEPAGAEPAGPSIFTALTEQLGLRLEATKAPVDAIVIDGVERPSEN